MKRRCAKPKEPGFALYGGRGIKVCSRWRGSFAAFAEDMGHPPTSDHSLDRIDVDGHYSCGKCEECKRRGWSANCRWSSTGEQARNKRTTIRITIDGKTLTLMDWCQEYQKNYSTVRARLLLGWSPLKSLTTPTQRRSPSSGIRKLKTAWYAMIGRCHRPRTTGYQRYGGRGIIVCSRWRKSFDAFAHDMGLPPSPKHSLDRIDNDGPYSPTNCRWATAKTQSNNQRRGSNITHFLPRMMGDSSQNLTKPTDKEDLIKLFRVFGSWGKVALHLGHDRHWISRRIRWFAIEEKEVHSNRRGVRKLRITKAEIDRAANLRSQGLTYGEVGQAMGISRHVASNWARKAM